MHASSRLGSPEGCTGAVLRGQSDASALHGGADGGPQVPWNRVNPLFRRGCAREMLRMIEVVRIFPKLMQFSGCVSIEVFHAGVGIVLDFVRILLVNMG